MNCCCCGKPLKNNDINGWHPACVKRFFGTKTIPEIEIDEKTLEEIAKGNTSKGILEYLHFFYHYLLRQRGKEFRGRQQSRGVGGKQRVVIIVPAARSDTE